MSENLKNKISLLVPDAVFEETSQWLNVSIDSGKWLELAVKLRLEEDLLFDYLFCITCVDWKTNLSMVYHFESTVHRQILVVKTKKEHACNKN